MDTGEWYYIYTIPDRIAHWSKRGPNRLHRRRNVHSLHWSKLRIYHQPISPKKEGNERMYLFYVYPILLNSLMVSTATLTFTTLLQSVQLQPRVQIIQLE